MLLELYGILTDATLSCPGLLLKTTPLPSGYPMVSGGWYMTPKSRFRDLVLNHQLLTEPEPKKRSKRTKLDQQQYSNATFLTVRQLSESLAKSA